MSDDLISRQDAIDLLKKWSGGYDYIETETESAIKDFQQLPTAQPEKCEDCGNFNKARLLIPQPEQKWIPVSEGLPKLGEKVLVSTKNTVFTQVFKRIYGTPDMWGWEHNSIKKVTAWMPLPESYKERSK